MLITNGACGSSGKKIVFVSPGYLKEKNISDPEGFVTNDTETVVFVISDNPLAGYIALSDEIRPESAKAIKTLHQNHIKSILPTGDNSKVAKSVSDSLGWIVLLQKYCLSRNWKKLKSFKAKANLWQ